MMMILIRMTFITVANNNDGAVDNGDQLVICLIIKFNFVKMHLSVNF